MRNDDDTKAAWLDLERQILGYAKFGLPLVTVVLTVIIGMTHGPPMGVLVLAAGALVGVIAMFWASVRTMLGETPLTGADAYAIAAPRAEEEQKRAVLRALKDLEFEKSVGKISEEDYRVLVARYRAEAKRLLQALEDDAKPKRDHVEALVAKRLRREGMIADEEAATETTKASKAARKRSEAKDEKRAEPPAEAAATEADAARDSDAPSEEPEAGQEERASLVCAACSTKNEADAVFCKKCGARRTAEAEGEA